MKVLHVILLLLLCGLSANAESVRIGFAVKDITPKAEDIKNGINTSGWSATSKALQSGDRLFVRAMAMRDRNNTLLVILTADTCKFHPADAYILQDWFENTFKVSRWHLLMNASHTHQAPNSYPANRFPYAAVYHKIFIGAVKTAVTEAVNNANTPVTIKYANLKIDSNMVYNKIHRQGLSEAKNIKNVRNNKSADYLELARKFDLIDRDFPVFAFFNARTGKIAGFFWSVAAHPTCYAFWVSDGMRISSHTPGAVARELQKAYGKNVISMFGQGAAGDIKMCFPAIDDKLKPKTGGMLWLKGPHRGSRLTQAQYFQELNDYAMLYVNIIQQGFKDGKFKEVNNINLKIAGREVKMPLALERPPRKSRLGEYNRCYWQRPKGTVESYRKVIADKNATEMEKYRAYEALAQIYDDKHAAYSLFVARIMFNEHLQIAAMSNEVCCEIGMEVKKYYRTRGIETVFLGYSPFGTPYYPSNSHKAEGTYQGSWMHPEKEFDFNKFALDSISALNPK